MSLPDGWQEQMVEMIRGAKPLDGAWFAGGPALSPEEQIGVYRDQYRLRLYDAVAEEVPGLVHLLGEQAEETLRAYIAAHPSTSWTLNDVANHLAAWLEAQQGPVEQVEMAQLDRAVQRGFTAARGTPIQAEQLAVMPPLRLQPHVTLLRHTTNVHRIRSAALAGNEVPELVRDQDLPLVIFRRGIKMRHWRMESAPWAILAGIEAGRPLAEVLGGLVEDEVVTPDALQQQIAGWFRDFAERNLVEVAATGR